MLRLSVGCVPASSSWPSDSPNIPGVDRRRWHFSTWIAWGAIVSAPRDHANTCCILARAHHPPEALAPGPPRVGERMVGRLLARPTPRPRGPSIRYAALRRRPAHEAIDRDALVRMHEHGEMLQRARFVRRARRVTPRRTLRPLASGLVGWDALPRPSARPDCRAERASVGAHRSDQRRGRARIGAPVLQGGSRDRLDVRGSCRTGGGFAPDHLADVAPWR